VDVNSLGSCLSRARFCLLSSFDGGARVGREGDLIALVRRMVAVVLPLLRLVFLPLVAVPGDEAEWILVLRGSPGEILVLFGLPCEVGWVLRLVCGWISCGLVEFVLDPWSGFVMGSGILGRLVRCFISAKGW